MEEHIHPEVVAGLSPPVREHIRAAFKEMAEEHQARMEHLLLESAREKEREKATLLAAFEAARQEELSLTAQLLQEVRQQLDKVLVIQERRAAMGQASMSAMGCQLQQVQAEQEKERCQAQEREKEFQQEKERAQQREREYVMEKERAQQREREYVMEKERAQQREREYVMEKEEAQRRVQELVLEKEEAQRRVQELLQERAQEREREKEREKEMVLMLETFAVRQRLMMDDLQATAGKWMKTHAAGHNNTPAVFLMWGLREESRMVADSMPVIHDKLETFLNKEAIEKQLREHLQNEAQLDAELERRRNYLEMKMTEKKQRLQAAQERKQQKLQLKLLKEAGRKMRAAAKKLKRREEKKRKEAEKVDKKKAKEEQKETERQERRERQERGGGAVRSLFSCFRPAAAD